MRLWRLNHSVSIRVISRGKTSNIQYRTPNIQCHCRQDAGAPGEACIRLLNFLRPLESGLTISAAAKKRKSRKQRFYFEPLVHFGGDDFSWVALAADFSIKPLQKSS
jgi:hypothetical protein